MSDKLAHFGVKGMKWGVRRDRKSTSRAPGSEDHDRSAAIRTQAKTSGTHTLSNAQLKTAIERMNLEQQYSNLATQKSTIAKGRGHVKKTLETANLATASIKTIKGLHSLIS